MNILEQILEEIEKEIRMKKAVWDSLEKPPYNDFEQRLWIAGMRNAKDIIRSHMEDDDMDIDAGDEKWIPADICLPPNAQHKGAFCPKYDVLTKYGATMGWYNPDVESWYVLIWFMTERYSDSEIDFDRGDIPKMVRAPLSANIVTAWKPKED